MSDQVRSTLLRAKKLLFSDRMTELHTVSQKVNVDKTLKGTLLEKAVDIDKLRSDFESVIEELETIEIKANSDYQPTFEGLDSFMDMYSSVKYAVQKFQGASNTKSTSPVEVPKIPVLDLPSFNGNPRDWPIFYETFKSVIHTNKSLSDDQKVQYLISRLKDQALSLCSGIPPIGSNYETIFKALTDRYQDVRSLASYYIDNILNFKTIKEESKAEYNNFIDQFGASVAALRALKIENLDEFLLYAIGIKKLDVEMRKKFETKFLENEGLPLYSDLIKFVQDYVRVIERTDRVAPVSKFVPTRNRSHMVSMVAASSHNEDTSCQVCKKGKHPLFQCGEFGKMEPSQRFEQVKSLKLCFNCFSPHHSVIRCSSKHTCKICKYKHHTMLHLNSYAKFSAEEPKPSSNHVKTQDSVVACCSASSSSSHVKHHTVLLATVKVNVRNTSGEDIKVRMLLDSGSMCNFITKSCCSKLGLKYQPATLSVSGVGSSVSETKGITSFQFSSRFDNNKHYVVPNALVIDKISKLPTCHVDVHSLKYLEGLQLSDDTFHTPGNIDCLIGAELFPQIVKHRRVMPNDSPVILESELGDIIMGQVPALSSGGVPASFHVSHVSPEEPLETIVKKFWHMEEVPSPADELTLEEKKCDKYFVSTTQRLANGRYSVSLPFKVSPSNLGNSHEIAKKRLLNLEKKFQIDPEFYMNYKKAINAYMDDGHASLVQSYDTNSESYFMSHFAVVRLNRLTTKTRIVFDNSCVTSTGVSLNDVLHTGPMLYKSLFDLLTKFRLFPFAYTGDIKAMFLQVVIQEPDRKYQRFLWRDSTSQPIQCYEMERLVFGARPSPFLAQRVLLQLASDEGIRYPEAAMELSQNFYMDDYLSSYLDKEEAVSTVTKLVSLLQEGGFELTKLASNDIDSLNRVSKSDKSIECVEWDTDTCLKVLGVQWNPTEDCFTFKVNLEDLVFTKRGILSTVAKIFDILGLISPVITFAKLIIKDLWRLKIDWDEKLPDSICQKWKKFVQELYLLQDLKIARHLSIVKDSTVRLIGFCDASFAAMGACVYAHVDTGGVINTHLICAKSKIAPTKYVTIPRLELCSSLLLAKLMDSVLKTFQSKYEIEQVICFSDSKVALYWISSESVRWKTFVANRVTKIQELVSEDKWFHVKGTENPADCLSRGITPKELISHKLWSNGPTWLPSPVHTWMLSSVNESALSEQMSNDKLLEEKLNVLHIGNSKKSEENVLLKLSLRISKWNILLRTVALVLKFCHLLPGGTITVQDLETSELKLIQALQNEVFCDDLKNLKNNKPISHSLLKLRPFVKDNTLLCGGRISNANQIGYHHAHPIILPKKHHIVNLLINYEHEKNLHTGPQLLLSIIRKKYWIIGGRDIVRQQVMKCVVCFKNNPKTVNPIMADLPPCRVQESKAFLHCGVDYAGPFNVTISRHRGVKTQKAYLCLFICMTTKALHLELASSLTTEAFLSCLRRFIARRGTVKVLYCDQGTNFVGASNMLSDMYKFLDSKPFKDAFENELLNQRIVFRFNPPASPHFGGLWESNVRQVKTHLYKVIGSQILSYEELYTIFTEIESICNSKPLCPIDSDASAPQALTPAHFLMQQPAEGLLCAGEVPLPLSQRFKLVSQLVQSFWKRFSNEYLSQLQERAKWLKDDVQLKPGLLVLIKSDNSPVLSWPLGRILEVFPGQDDVVRVARVQVKGGELRRPAVKLCPLPNQEGFE
uniref:Integrase catalytic domain-containing protein n=1 Tax=Cacopsylla melanoneura TaxID=428564 RepID=A0A8D8SE53_9HEMI